MAITETIPEKLLGKGCSNLRLFNATESILLPYLASIKVEESTSDTTYKADNEEISIASASTTKLTLTLGSFPIKYLPWVTVGTYDDTTKVFTKKKGTDTPVLGCTYLKENIYMEESESKKKYTCVRLANIKATSCNILDGTSGDVSDIVIEATVSYTSDGKIYEIGQVNSATDAFAKDITSAPTTQA